MILWNSQPDDHQQNKFNWVEMSARLVPVLQNLRRKLRRDWLGRDQSQLRSEGLWDELNKVPRYVFANEAGRIDDHANIAERF